MDVTGLLIFGLMIALMGYLVYAKIKRDQREFDRLYKPADEHAFDGGEFGEVFAFQGDQQFQTETFPLKAGSYKLMYWFPEEVMVKVELFSEAGDDSEVIALKSGEGTASFSIDYPGRYFCVIEPTEEAKPWEIEISRLGLPSSARPSTN